MTKVDVRYEFTAPYEERWTAAIEAVHGIYGLQAVKLSPKLDGLTVTYDASRLKLTDVAHHLLRAGLPVRQVEA